MRRARSNFRPQVNIPKAKKTKKDEAGENSVGANSGGQQSSQTVDVAASAADTEPVLSASTAAECSLPSEKETAVASSPVKQPTIPPLSRVSPLPFVEASSSEDEGVIDPYDPNNPQGTRVERERGIFRKSQRFQKAYSGGKPMSMIDYLFYNPKGTPMMHFQPTKITPTTRDEEDEDDPEIIEDKEEEQPRPKFAPTVQLKLGPDGTFQVDEKSLILETTEAREGREKLSKSSIACGLNYSNTNRGRTTRIKWTNNETVFFYKCLSILGTDFEMISKYFPGRTRHHIKLKFKLEERANPHLITKAFESSNFDVTELQNEYEIVAQRANEERKRRKTGGAKSTAKGRRKKRKSSDEEEDKGSASSTAEGDTDVEEEMRADMEADRKPRKEDLHILHIKRENKQRKEFRQNSSQEPVVTQQSVQLQLYLNSPSRDPATQTSQQNPVMRQILSTGLVNATPLSSASVMQNIAMKSQNESSEKVLQFMRVENKALASLTGQNKSNHFSVITDTNSLSIVPSSRIEISENNSVTLSDQSTKLNTENLIQMEYTNEVINASETRSILATAECPKQTLERLKNVDNVSESLSSIEGNANSIEQSSTQKGSNESELLVLDEHSSDSSDSEEEMELEFLSKTPQPTRSGRLPKHNKPTEDFPVPTVKRRQSGASNRQVHKKVGRRPKYKNVNNNQISSAVAPMNMGVPSPVPSETADASRNDNQELIALHPDVDPGSLLVLKTSDPNNPEKVLYKVFMISPDCGGTTVVHNADGSIQAVSASTDTAKISTNVSENLIFTRHTSLAVSDASASTSVVPTTNKNEANTM